MPSLRNLKKDCKEVQPFLSAFMAVDVCLAASAAEAAAVITAAATAEKQ